MTNAMTLEPAPVLTCAGFVWPLGDEIHTKQQPGMRPVYFVEKYGAATQASAVEEAQPKALTGWRPAETLESRGATVLVKNDRGQVCPMSRGVIHNNPGSAHNDWDSNSTITGWMPLPPADAAQAPAPSHASPAGWVVRDRSDIEPGSIRALKG